MTATTEASCIWCTAPYDPADCHPDTDFGRSVGYCSSDCELAHCELLERNQREVQAHERAVYQQEYMLEADWRQHLAPVGDADRCRHCTGVYFTNDASGAGEFCSAECEHAYCEALSRWCDQHDRDSDTEATAA